MKMMHLPSECKEERRYTLAWLGFLYREGWDVVMRGCLLWLNSLGTRVELMSQCSYTSPLEHVQAAHHLNAGPVLERPPSQINSKSYLCGRSIKMTSILINELGVINTFYTLSAFWWHREVCKTENRPRLLQNREN